MMANSTVSIEYDWLRRGVAEVAEVGQAGREGFAEDNSPLLSESGGRGAVDM